MQTHYNMSTMTRHQIFHCYIRWASTVFLHLQFKISSTLHVISQIIVINVVAIVVQSCSFLTAPKTTLLNLNLKQICFISSTASRVADYHLVPQRLRPHNYVTDVFINLATD